MTTKLSVHPSFRKLEFFNDRHPLKDVCPCLRAVDSKAPHCVWSLVYEDEEDVIKTECDGEDKSTK